MKHVLIKMHFTKRPTSINIEEVKIDRITPLYMVIKVPLNIIFDIDTKIKPLYHHKTSTTNWILLIIIVIMIIIIIILNM